MADWFSSKLSRCGLVAFSLLLISSVTYGETTFLELDQTHIEAVSSNSISFKGLASNGVSYKAGLSCFDQIHYKKGNLRVLKSEYHVGASTTFSYEDCIQMRKTLQEGTEKLLISWDQEGFDDFISARLSFERIRKPLVLGILSAKER